MRSEGSKFAEGKLMGKEVVGGKPPLPLVNLNDASSRDFKLPYKGN